MTGRPMETGSHMVQASKIYDTLRVCDATRIAYRYSNEVNEFILDELVTFPNRIKDFPYGDRHC